MAVRTPLAPYFNRHAWLALLLSAAACSSEASGSPDAQAGDAGAEAAQEAAVALQEARLIDHSAWHNYPAELDPLAAHQPAPIKCGLTGWFVERSSLEVDTTECNYVLIEHPALVGVPAGSEVELELWHFDLIAPEPAQAHLALLFDADLQWETFVDIPSLGNLERVRFRTTRELALGEPIRFHLHNHGQNTWMLGDVLTWIPAPE
jgi:hypothetical protein